MHDEKTLITGKCHCGAVRYEAQGPLCPAYSSATLVWVPQWGQVKEIGTLEFPLGKRVLAMWPWKTDAVTCERSVS